MITCGGNEKNNEFDYLPPPGIRLSDVLGCSLMRSNID